MNILACSVGSHSFKAAIYGIDERAVTDDDSSPQPALWEGSVTWSSPGMPALVREDGAGRAAREASVVLGSFRLAPERLLRGALDGVRPSGSAPLAVDAVAHRIVHCCGDHTPETGRVDEALRQAISMAATLAPNHNPGTLASFDAVTALCGPDVPQIAVFDAAFHADLPKEASTYAVPRSWREVWGIRKVGFHGISHRYCAQRAAALLERPLTSLRIVSCALGGGASLAAIAGGRSIETTMGWSTLDGLVMGERCGSIDPGILLYLLRRNRYTAEELSHELYEHSGLLGLSGVSGDMRDVLDGMKGGLPNAKLAFDVYVHRLRAGIASMVAALRGIDVLAFTAGVGENAAEVRQAVCDGLGFLDIGADADRNRAAKPDADIAPAGARVRVLVIRGEERWALAREGARYLQRASNPTAP